ncbi:MAG TPA: aminotransferase class I/II-fold pyridoxal phosphate-dependent enzyme [Candidatus Dormibacteraeota bacterium]|nr:aminotransferase class I/II-fold pyridoxal phosphate-dependent enzyme [Candidatus Dormibacteraeota bacterium]
MGISRRRLLHGIGSGAVAAATLPGIAAGRSVLLMGAPENGGPIHLDRNENPYGAPESAMAAMRESLKSPNRYPDGSVLTKKIAEHHNVSAEQVVLGCGSSEILRMAADAFLAPGRKLVLATPTCPILASYARQKGVEVVEVPLTREFAHDLVAMLPRCDHATGMVYICNPNNPTGTLTPQQDVQDFLHKLPAGIPVLIDEAYHHYVAATPSYASFLDQPGDEHTIVTRTFSKIYGLAGVRIGYAVAPKALATRLPQFALPFGENAAGIAGAMAALDDREFVSRSADRNRADKQTFFNSADVRYIRVTDTQTNFTLLRLDHPIDEVIAHFRANGIFVGPRFPQLDNYLRVSIGRPEESREFWRVWDMLPHKPVHGMSHGDPKG